MKKGVDLPKTNWLGAGTALLMSPRQGETNQHRGMKYDVALGLMKVFMRDRRTGRTYHE